MSNEAQRDDALFEALGKNKKKRRQKIIRTVVIVVVVLAVILTAAVVILRRQVRERFAGSTAEVQSYEASRGTISTTVSGSGSLTEVDLEQLEIPDGVEILEVLAERDDIVEEGDVLAEVDMASVMTALSGLQAELDELDEQISDAKGDTVSSSVTAGVSGRVKILYARKGDSVVNCMAENGALAVISLDGFMAADIETDALSASDAVTVLRADGSEIDGTVETVSRGVATILVSDNGPEYDEEITVLSADGTQIGTGKLYIHNPLSVTGYAGTVSNVSVSLNSRIYSTTTLFTLKDTSSSANYDTLLRSRSEKEEELMEVLTIYRDGAILAPFSGKVSSIDYSEENTAVLLTMCPNEQMSVTISVDETDILSLEEGQEADITVSSVSEDAFTGTVTEISKVATTSSGVTVYSAVVTLDKAEGMLPGMTASVDVKIEGVEDAILVPVEAVHQTSAISYVYTSYDEETQTYGDMVEVVTGLWGSNYVEIVSGIEEGTTVYYTEEVTFSFGFGGMGGMEGGFSFEVSGDGMPSGDFSGMPSGGGDRGDRGGNSGGMPSGGGPGGMG
ncbi:MAG: HlyD family efflux transporter periplasmic adaptor subunit [Oscillospiraceae bacterium]|nr:HlyD family efflux transporter periplasmic adaptor subunit [Oscillospiraceae bacterium]